MSLHPALEAAKRAIEIRRTFRAANGYSKSEYRHDPLLPAYWNECKVLYCPVCLEGHVTDLVGLEYLQNVKELGVQLVRPWPHQCTEKLKVRNDNGANTIPATDINRRTA